jgi:hypothetical protein
MTSMPSSSQRLLGQVSYGIVTRGLALARGHLASLGISKLPQRDEFAQLRPALRRLMIGLAAWIGLVGIVTIAAIVSLGLSSSDFHAFGLHSSAATGSVQRSSTDYDVILQRPLFSRSRQAAAQVSPILSPPPVHSDRNISLKGVFISGATAKAFLTSTQNPLGVWIESNNEIAGWRVVSISPDQVVLNAQNDEMVIPLGVKDGAGNLTNGRAILGQEADAMPPGLRGKMMNPKPGIAHSAQALIVPLGINGGRK